MLYELGGLSKENMPLTLRKEICKEAMVISKAQKPVILVLNVCGPVDLSYLNRKVVKAVVCIFLPGMGGAKALCHTLIGKVNPSGKLPVTFPLHYEDSSAYLNFPGDGYEVNYGEGIYVGYRYFEKKKCKPLYPFGFGLSYTTFSLGEIKDIKVDNSVEVSFGISIKNEGEREGAQVIQVYVSDPYSTLSKPVKELKAFQKVFLLPGEEKEVLFQLSSSDFASYDSDLHQFTVEEGYYDILVGYSSDEKDIVRKERIYLDVESPYSYGIQSSIKTLYENACLQKALQQLWKENGWDWQIILSNYQYTSNRSLYEVLPNKDPKGSNLFLDQLKKVKKA